MKKKIIIISAVIVFAIILIIILNVTANKTDRLLNMYKKMSNNQNFTFSMEEVNEDFPYTVTTMQRGTDVSINMYSGGEHMTTLVVDGHAYYIIHSDKEYYDYGEDRTDIADSVLFWLEDITQKTYNTGKEEIDGKIYYYEEYDDEKAQFIIYADPNEASSIKTRFYFEKNELKYIKNIITTDDEVFEELIKIELKYDIDESLFEIPDDYAEIET